MFFAYRQNNTFGRFDYSEELGISGIVVVEAFSREEANSRFEHIGYFDGVDKDRDCDCCGDRWSRISEWDEGYSDIPDLMEDIKNYLPYREVGPIPVFVHYRRFKVGLTPVE